MLLIEVYFINLADELVDRGYQEDLKHILSMFKTCMQTILFANSMSDKLDRFLDSILKQKTIVKCNYRNSLISRSNQKLEYVKQDYRLKYLYECVSRNTDSFLIIALNIREAEEITAYLVKKEADALSIKSRDALSMFKNGKLTILVATHSILKDIDFPIMNLINYEVPTKKEYIERLIKAKDANVTTIVNRFSRDENMNDMKMLYQEFGISIPVFLQEFGVVGGEWEKCMKA